ncbi:MAG: hypothetical protein PWP30_1779 [Eubacteriaceae bacterium]|nr:hypothetical protein [Eubacteriaceae bacterium]
MLQTRALPLGYGASYMERKTGFEPATLALARRCSTTEPLPQRWCPEAESNHRHEDFQSSALPTELSGHTCCFPLVFEKQLLISNRLNSSTFKMSSPFFVNFLLKRILKMATWKRLELSTSSVTGWHSNQLNYQANLSKMVVATGLEPVTLCL